MKYVKLLIVGVILGCFMQGSILAADFKIGVVDLNRAINESEAGIRSKNILQADVQRKKQELKLEEEDLKKQIQGMRNNLLLTPEAKQKKETELRKKQQSLIGKSRKFEQTFRQEERRLTIEILKEIKPVIRTVAQKEKYDLVLEKIAVREIILYMNQDTVDLTQKVVDHYNLIRNANN